MTRAARSIPLSSEFAGDQPRKGRQHRDRQIVDAKIAEVFESVGRGRHPRATEPGDDHDVRSSVCFCLSLLSGGLFHGDAYAQAR